MRRMMKVSPKWHFRFSATHNWQNYKCNFPNTYLSPHYDDVIMIAMASQITSLTIVYSTVYSDTDERKHQSSASLAFVMGIHRLPVNSPHKGPVTRKMFPFDDVTMIEDTGTEPGQIITVVLNDNCRWTCGDLGNYNPERQGRNNGWRCHVQRNVHCESDAAHDRDDDWIATTYGCPCGNALLPVRTGKTSGCP